MDKPADSNLEARQLIAGLRASWRRATGRDYHVDLNPLNVTTLRELQRLTHDLDHEKLTAVQRARLMPWRR